MSLRLVIRTTLVQCLLLSCISPLQAQGPAKPKPRIVATFNDTAITDEDLNKAAAAELDNLKLQIQQSPSMLEG